MRLYPGRIFARFSACLFPAALAAMLALPNAAPAQGMNQPIRVKQRSIDVTVNPDGTSTTVYHDEIQVLTEAAIANAAQQPISYEARTQDIEIGEAYTLKADGTKIPVGRDTIMTQQNPSTSGLAPVYSDSQRKIIIFPNVQVNDTLVFNFTVTAKQAYFPGQYSRGIMFSPTTPLDDMRITFRMPKTMPLTVEAQNVRQTKTETSDRLVYEFQYARTVPEPASTAPVSEPWRRDRVFVTTLKSYDDIAHIYADLALPKAAVTPKIQAQADAITKGITDKKLMAKALYEWVNRRVRYVAIELGVGGIVPHDAEWTLTNAYGDCKDQATLLTALLNAKGIKAYPVMIFSGRQYRLLDTPTPSQFNHVITYLPDYKIYADTTATNTAFGELPMADYAKPVLHTVADGPARFSTPLLPPGLLTSTSSMNARVDEEGRVTATASTTMTGPWAASWRGVVAQIAAGGSSRFADAFLRDRNLSQATGDFILEPQDNSPSFTLGSNLLTQKLQPHTNLMPAILGLRIAAAAGDVLIGPLANTRVQADDPTPCYSGRQVENITLEIPAGKMLVKLPSDLSIKDAAFSYESKWTQSGQTISLHRELNAAMKEPVCAGPLRRATAAALARIRQDQEQPLMLAD
jgi:transglutaminase-like putative cysteine protease